jgi:hypothetical protein
MRGDQFNFFAVFDSMPINPRLGASLAWAALAAKAIGIATVFT